LSPGQGNRHCEGGTPLEVIQRARFAFLGQAAVSLKGLYKFAFKTARGTGCGVMFATEDGKLYGGNSGSSFVGSYTVKGEEIVSEMMMSRHNHDPAYAPMYPVDNIVMTFRSRWRGDELHSKGGTAALPGVVFESVLRAINDADAPPAGRVGPNASATGFIPSTSACSTASTAATPAS